MSRQSKQTADPVNTAGSAVCQCSDLPVLLFSKPFSAQDFHLLHAIPPEQFQRFRANLLTGHRNGDRRRTPHGRGAADPAQRPCRRYSLPWSKQRLPHGTYPFSTGQRQRRLRRINGIICSKSMQKPFDVRRTAGTAVRRPVHTGVLHQHLSQPVVYRTHKHLLAGQRLRPLHGTPPRQPCPYRRLVLFRPQVQRQRQALTAHGGAAGYLEDGGPADAVLREQDLAPLPGQHRAAPLQRDGGLGLDALQ